MQRFIPRLTYANVVSTLALFLVLSGATAFAATQLGKNSVGTKQLKKNSVTAAKIKKNAVTGAKVNVSTLKTVPSATLAETIPPAEATHYVGEPGQPAFEHGSVNYPGEGKIKFNRVGFYKDHEGIVHLQGVALGGKNPGGPASVFTLPAGYRPAAGTLMVLEQTKESVSLIAGTSTLVEGKDISGMVIGEQEKPVILDGITFRAES
jgi:hypothetical protein